MSIADGKTRYVSTFRIQLSDSQSKGANGQGSQPTKRTTITTAVKKPEETSSTGKSGNYLNIVQIHTSFCECVCQYLHTPESLFVFLYMGLGRLVGCLPSKTC